MAPCREKMMIKLDPELIGDMPFHDSDLVEMGVLQNDQGDTTLTLRIVFHEDYHAEMKEDYPGVINSDGVTTIIVEGCTWISINAFCNRTQRDEIDYITFVQGTTNLHEGLNHVEIMFISGSKIETHAKALLVERC